MRQFITGIMIFMLAAVCWSQSLFSPQFLSVATFPLIHYTNYIEAIGDSITVANNGALTNYATQRYSYLVASNYARSDTNYGVGGSTITDAGQSDVITALTTYPMSIRTWNCGNNDAMQNGTNAGWLAMSQLAQTALAALLCVPSANVYTASNPAITYTGNWQSLNENLPGVGVKTGNDATATASFSISGTNIVCFSAQNGSGSASNISFTCDGTSTVVFNCGNRPNASTIQGRFYNLAVGALFTNLVAGSHTITITNLTSSYGYFCGAAAWGNQQLPILLITSDCPHSPYGYVNSGFAPATNSSPAAVAAWANMSSNVVVECKSLGLNISWAAMYDGFFNTNLDYSTLLNDGVHIGIWGHLKMATNIEAHLQPLQ